MKAEPWCGFCVEASPLGVSGDHWQWVVLLAGSAPGVKPLLRLLGLWGVAIVGVASTLEAGSTTEQLFCGSRGWTGTVLGTTDACRSPSMRRGGLMGAGAVGVVSEIGGLGLHGGEGLRALWLVDFDSSSCGSCWFCEGVSLSEGGGLVDSGGGSCCMLLCLEAPEPGISQLSVRRREPSCIRLVATTAFMAAWWHTHTLLTSQTHTLSFLYKEPLLRQNICSDKQSLHRESDSHSWLLGFSFHSVEVFFIFKHNLCIFYFSK